MLHNPLLESPLLEYEGKAGQRQAGHKNKDVQPRATFSIAKELPSPSPLCLGCGRRSDREEAKESGYFLVSWFSTIQTVNCHSLELLLFLFFFLAASDTGRDKAEHGEEDGEP